jgi:hypothetical protein
VTGRPIVFVDTETTALGPLARPWEIAVIRRVEGVETEFVGQITYTLETLPKGTSTEALRIGGWLHRGAPNTKYVGHRGETDFRWADERAAALDLKRYFQDGPVVVGVGPHFDAEILAGLFGRTEVGASWHYALVDLKAATWGYLHGQDALNGLSGVPHEALQLPMSSEALSRAIDVEPPAEDERHTALGDARWARRWFDALTGGAR